MKQQNDNEAENLGQTENFLPSGAATCSDCGGGGMLPGVEPNDDVMNTPCPECNPWAKKRLLLDIHDRYRPTPESDATIQIACAPINGRATDEDVQRFGIMIPALRNMERERDALQRQVWSLEKVARERNDAMRVLRVLKSDIDHIGHWLPDPCRKMVETFISENV